MHSDPTWLHRSALAERHFRAGEFAECRSLIVALQADGVDTPLARIALAAMDARQGDDASATKHLLQIEKMNGVTAQLLVIAGRLYLRLKRPRDAIRLLEAAIERDSGLGSAYDAMAVACLLTRDLSGALFHAQEAVSREPNSYDSQYHLGLVFVRQGRHDEAIEAFKASVGLAAPGDGASAHRRLADLLDHKGDRAFALHHRAQSYRPDRMTRLPWLDGGGTSEGPSL
ncbi:MAG: hypothetical protein C0485_19525 [Pirellula sp.]|nr:hypothetical protein [Pirellula sp.]